MRSIYNIITLLFAVTASAQLYVGPNAGTDTYMYVENTFIFVEQEVELVANTPGTGIDEGVPSIALRKEAQLLQGTTGSTNVGDGKISVFQEGTTNQWDYNNYSSPVSRVSAIGVTAADVIGVPQTVLGTNKAAFTTDWDSSYDGATNTVNVSSHWIYTYDSPSGDNSTFNIKRETGVIEPAKGFTLKGVSDADPTEAGDGVANNQGWDESNPDLVGQRYDFRGKANTGTYTIPIASENTILIGNPYPSAIDLDYFLLENSAGPETTYDYVEEDGTTTTVTLNRQDVLTGTAFYYESDPSVQSHYYVDYYSGYATYSPMGSVGTAGIYMPATLRRSNEDGEFVGPGGPIPPGAAGSGGRKFAPVGQAFYVDASTFTGGNRDITFKNEYRLDAKDGTADSSFRSSSSNTAPTPIKGIRLNYEDADNIPQTPHVMLSFTVNEEFNRYAAIAFLPGASHSVEKGIDAYTYDYYPNDISLVLENNSGYVISGDKFEETYLHPIEIKATNYSSFVIKVKDMVNFDHDGVWLYDDLTRTFTNILDDSFEISLEPGVYDNRFYIAFYDKYAEEDETDEEEEDETDEQDDDESEDDTTDSDESDDSEEEEDTTDNDESDDESDEDSDTDNTDESEDTTEDDTLSTQDEILDSIAVIQNNTTSELSIYNPLGAPINQVQLFDIMGKQIFDHQNLETTDRYTFSTAAVSDGIYLLRYLTKTGEVNTKRISVLRRN